MISDINSGTDKPLKASFEKRKKFIRGISDSLEKKWPLIREKLLELSQEVNCECFPKIFEKELAFSNKLIWASLFSIFSALTCFLLAQNVLDFFRQVIENFLYEHVHIFYKNINFFSKLRYRITSTNNR